jgi:hypothetical protein
LQWQTQYRASGHPLVKTLPTILITQSTDWPPKGDFSRSKEIELTPLFSHADIEIVNFPVSPTCTRGIRHQLSLYFVIASHFELIDYQLS